jgi:cytochrome c-type biogenesis protein CcmF
MDYIGEHLLPGKIGHLLIIISFIASILAAFSYYQSFRSIDPSDQSNWKQLGRISFLIDAVSVTGVFVLLYFLIANHRYEYQYVYKNSGNDLEPKYIFSSLWSASEGSFILWTVWHAILGIILMFTSKKWEGPVMMVLSFAQVCLVTMLLGIYVFGIKIGSNPFVLFREQMPNLPIFGYADYATRIIDGNGLNQLLQNYWMVIHPPVLFLGFASMIIPFSFAIGGLMTKNYGEWTKPALPWALFSACVLGVGVMMGAAWAYESLSFGGYWAWDPVENASLVPWLVLVAGIHTILIYRHTGRSLKTAYLLISLAFILIVYSTFLTRSGILGETSVHSFADLGMNAQLYLFLYIFFWLPAIISSSGLKNQFIALASSLLFLILAGYVHSSFALISPLAALAWMMFNLNKVIPSEKKEEAASSREFWMFIGSLVLFISAVIITIQTSVPVFNKIFNTKHAPAQDVEFSYNRIQIFIAIIIGILTAITQYLKYKETSSGYFLKKIIFPLVISFIAAGLALAFGNIHFDKYGFGYLAAIWMAVACAVFAVIANLSYIWLGVKGSLKLSGPSVAHLGFGLMLLGILISSSKKETLSYNTSGIPINFGPDSKENTGENLTLVKEMRTDMGKYWVTYTNDSVHPKKSQWYYKLKFESKDGKENFTLTPNAFVNYQGNEGLMANPDARHYWDHDIFAYITAIPDPEKNQDTSAFEKRYVKAGDSVFYSRGFMILEEVKSTDSLPVEIFGETGKLFTAKMNVYSKTNSVYTSIARMAIAKGEAISIPDTVMAESLILQLNGFDGKTAEVGIKESDTVLQYITLKAYKFPFINVLWLGTILMSIGFIISMVRRMQVNKTIKD